MIRNVAKAGEPRPESPRQCVRGQSRLCVCVAVVVDVVAVLLLLHVAAT